MGINHTTEKAIIFTLLVYILLLSAAAWGITLIVKWLLSLLGFSVKRLDLLADDADDIHSEYPHLLYLQ